MHTDGNDIFTYSDQKPSVILTQDPDYNVMFDGESVSFSCHINVSSGWEYQWYKGDRKLIISGNSHTIKTVAGSDTGSYSCQAKRGSNTVFNSDQSQVVTLDIKGTFLFNSSKPLFVVRRSLCISAVHR